MPTYSRCAACKYLRKKCPSDCIFSPYFPLNNPRRFENVHKIYGAGNIARMIQKIPVHLREHAIDSLHFEAHCRVEDPVYGCVKIISQLQAELNWAQNQLVKTQAEIALVLNIYGPKEEPFSDLQVNEEDDSCDIGYHNFQPNNYGLQPFDPSVLGYGLS
ncbi:LOB domain-containing protein 24 [Bienertia sinuspersici]